MAHITVEDLNKIQDALISRDPIACTVAQGIVASAKDSVADGALIEAARSAYQDDECEIDDDAGTSVADDGTWVQAWVWVAQTEEFTCDGCGREEGECSANPCADVIADREA